MSVAYPLVNGARHSWASVEIKVDNDIVLGIPEINYKAALDPSEVMGAGPMPIAFTLGKGTSDGDFSILLEEFNILMTKLGPNAMTKMFNIIVTYDESGSGLSTIVDTIVGCRMISIEASNSASSTDASIRKVPFKCLNILYNGVSALPALPSATS